MPGLLIKDLPPELRQRLKEAAIRHHRSMSKEALALLEEALSRALRPRTPPEPFEARFALTDEFLQKAKGEGRE